MTVFMVLRVTILYKIGIALRNGISRCLRKGCCWHQSHVRSRMCVVEILEVLDTMMARINVDRPRYAQMGG